MLNYITSRSVALSRIVVTVLGLFLSSAILAQGTITVDSIGDQGLADPTNQLCVSSAGDCTFRAALQTANNRQFAVNIHFSEDIPTNDVAGFSIIQPSSPLPEITTTVRIQGDTHPASSNGTPGFLINGATAGASASGLVITGGAPDSIVRQLSIYNFVNEGLVLLNASNVEVDGNYLGLRSFFPGVGQAQGNGGHGLRVSGGSGNLISDNWIGDNGASGIRVDQGSAANVLVGNQIGNRPVAGGSGSEPTGNGGHGILIAINAGSANQVGRCTVDIGPPITEFCEPNTITANAGAGIRIDSGEQIIQSNRIGVSAAALGNDAFGNSGDGVLIASDDNQVIGGSFSALSANVVGHNGGNGLRLANGASGNTISGAAIGITPDDSDIGNELVGIRVQSGSGNVFLQNRIHNNSSGIVLDSGVNEILNNEIIGNVSRGIEVTDGGQLIADNIIGNQGIGILFSHSVDATADGLLRIIGNHIGGRANGESLPNQVGIFGNMGGFSRIGDDDGRGNVIINNSASGLLLNNTSDSRIQANWIGLMPDGTAAGNGGSGIVITASAEGQSASNNRIGYLAGDSIPIEHVGTNDAVGNIIAYNDIGLRLFTEHEGASALRNVARGNRFMANTSGGIILEPGGDVIDPGGAETGPNNRQNFPEFDNEETFFNQSAGEIEFTYLVNTTSGNASYPLQVDFYIADGATRQGHTFLYTDEYTGFFAAQPKSGSFVPPAGLNLDDAWLVATATDADGNTSQFSEPLRLVQPLDQIFSDRFE